VLVAAAELDAPPAEVDYRTYSNIQNRMYSARLTRTMPVDSLPVSVYEYVILQ